MNYYLEFDGKNLKNLPLNVAIYIRTNGMDSNYCLSVYAKAIENYIHDETNWYVAASYVDFNRSGLYNWSTSKISDMMTDIEYLQENKNVPNFFIPYDLVVVYNFEQLFTLEMDKDSYLDLKFPTFCVDREKLVCRDLDVNENLIARARVHELDENNVRESINSAKENEMEYYNVEEL